MQAVNPLDKCGSERSVYVFDVYQLPFMFMVSCNAHSARAHILTVTGQHISWFVANLTIWEIHLHTLLPRVG